MDINKVFSNLLLEEDKKVASLDQMIDLLTETLPRFNVELLRDTTKKFRDDVFLPFDYGEFPDLINPADDDGWDIIISPDTSADEKYLRITGFVPVKNDADSIPYPAGNIPGNHKLILGRFGRISNQAINKIKEFFEPIEAFETPYFLNQGESNVYRHLWQRKQKDLRESHILNENHVMYYAGTSTKNKIKDKIKQWKNEPVIVTPDLKEAKSIAKDVCRRNGGTPVIYEVEPMGKMHPVHSNSTVTFIVDTANVKGELNETWEKATFGSYDLGHVNDGRWGGIAVGPTAKKMVDRLKEDLDISGNRAINLFSKILIERDDSMKYRIFCDLDGVLVNFVGGFRKKFEKTSLSSKINLRDDGTPIEDQLKEYFKSIAQTEKQAKSARSKGIAYFWAVIPGFELGLKKRSLFSPQDYDQYQKNILDFWTNLDWMEDGKELWDFLQELRDSGKISELNILSSPSSDEKIPNEEGELVKVNLAEKGKRQWLQNNGIIEGKTVDKIIIKRNKYEECEGPQDILIDDTPKKLYGGTQGQNLILGWTSKDGTDVLHKNTKNTIDKLKEIIDN